MGSCAPRGRRAEAYREVFNGRAQLSGSASASATLTFCAFAGVLSAEPLVTTPSALSATPSLLSIASTPHGLAVKFRLYDGFETDVVAHSCDGFAVADALSLDATAGPIRCSRFALPPTGSPSLTASEAHRVRRLSASSAARVRPRAVPLTVDPPALTRWAVPSPAWLSLKGHIRAISEQVIGRVEQVPIGSEIYG